MLFIQKKAMDKLWLYNKMTKHIDLTPKQFEVFIYNFFKEINEGLKEGSEISIDKWGTFTSSGGKIRFNELKTEFKSSSQYSLISTVRKRPVPSGTVQARVRATHHLKKKPVPFCRVYLYNKNHYIRDDSGLFVDVKNTLLNQNGSQIIITREKLF